VRLRVTRLRIVKCNRHGRFPQHLAITPVPQQLLHATDGIALLIEEAVDLADEFDVGRPVISTIAGALHRLQLWEAGLPVAQDMLGDAELLRQFANGQ
jgi:hypothetical protein